MVVPVAGLDAIGVSLDSGLVHHPERVAALLWIGQGETLLPSHVSRILVDPAGGLKRTPPGSEVRVLLTKAEGDRLASGREVAAGILASSPVRSRSGSLLPSLRWKCLRVAGVVLAAGGSSRPPAQTARPVAGKPLIWHAVHAALEGGSRRRSCWAPTKRRFGMPSA
jgi:hypothetical protein